MERLKVRNPDSNIKNKVMGAVAGMNAMLMTTMLAHATTENPWANVTTTIIAIFTTLEVALKSIVVPIAGCALVACFIMMLVSQNQKKVEAYRSWFITIVICIIAIYAVPFIIGLAQNIGEQF